MAQRAEDQRRRLTSDEFDRLVQRHRRSLERAAAGLTHGTEEAGDLVQETLLRAFRYRDKFEPGTNFGGWLYRILRNSAITRSQRATAPPVAWDEIFGSGGDVHATWCGISPAADDELLRSLFSEDLADALRELPSCYRDVILLTGLQGLSYAEAARTLDVPVGTIRSRLMRARGKLRDRLPQRNEQYAAPMVSLAMR